MDVLLNVSDRVQSLGARVQMWMSVCFLSIPYLDAVPKVEAAMCLHNV